MKIKNPLYKILGNKKWQAITIPIFAILCSLIVISIVILVVGKNPLLAFKSLLQGAGVWAKPNYSAYQSVLSDFMMTVDKVTPMIFAALSVAVGLKAGMFNIGVSGQMLFSAFISTILIGYSELGALLAKPLVLIVGAISGAFIGCLVGFLKQKFNINEVVTTIMLNYIIQYVVGFVISTRFLDSASRQSNKISEAARLTLTNVELFGLKLRIPLVFILAVGLAIYLKFFMDRTSKGYEIKAVGINPSAAKYSGINVGKTRLFAMAISGALAGLAGVSYYMGYYASIAPKTLSTTGFDAIAVSLLGNNNPIGIIFSSFLITIIENGATYMKSKAGVEQEIASLISGIILLFSACSVFIKHQVNKKISEQEEKEGEE